MANIPQGAFNRNNLNKPGAPHWQAPAPARGEFVYKPAGRLDAERCGDYTSVTRDGAEIGRIYIRWEEREPSSFWAHYTFVDARGVKSKEFATLAFCRAFVEHGT